MTNLWLACREVGWISECSTLDSFCLLRCLFSVVLGIPALCCSVSTHMPSFLLTSAGQLLLYAGIAGGSSLKAKLFQCWRLPEDINNLVCCSSPCLRPPFSKKNHLDSSVGIWLFGSSLVWQVGVYSPSSFLVSFTVIFCVCWVFPLFLPGWKHVGTGSLVCAAVAGPADTAPGHCPSDSSAVWSLSRPSVNPELSNPGEFQTEFNSVLPCNECFVHKLRGALSAAQNCEKKTFFWSTQYRNMTCSIFWPKNLLVSRKAFHRSSRMPLLRWLGLSYYPCSHFP